MSSESLIKAPFSGSQETLAPDCEYAPVDDPSRKKSSLWISWTRLWLILIYIPAIGLYVLSYLRYSAHNLHHCARGDDIPSPILKDDSVEWETKKFPQDFRDSVYAGDPSPELDLAWHYLFEDNNIRVEKEDLDALGLESVELTNGGYAAQLGVFHELHCLKRVRQWIFKDYYILPKNISEAEMKEWPPHINHCLEMLRQTIICRADTSLSTFKWMGPEGHRFPTAWDRSPHRCMKWETLTAWTKSRSFDISEPGIVIDEQGHPFP